ncbi:hypothetical protein SAMN05216207_102328 [Pseudonocardia ammonioxydans]|uniref:Capsular polysaccharide biosynthesis protein n=1 Tax=Pseudonocardia ammonioxydans TaxID=260086 RepID=A0A1I5CIH7_PSUAM|nr:hypothetical protein [Pseudonocardia ammonioxydans]SFN86723.1 hypothetical protein SAMN05216207_102328 [Pseudonocardia ammonioxydans]
MTLVDAPVTRPRPRVHEQRFDAGLVVRVVAVVLAAAVAGWLGAMLQPPVAVIRAVVVVALVDDDGSAERALATQTRMLTDRPVLVPVAARLGMPPESLAERVHAEADLQTGLITLDIRDADVAHGSHVAEQVVDEYLQTAYLSDVPADGLVRTRLLFPPHPVPDDRPGALTGAALGAGIGALAAGAVVLAGRRKWGRRG